MVRAQRPRLRAAEMTRRVLLLLSGGVDSAAALWLLRKENGASEVYTLSINFYRRSPGEAAAARRLSGLAGAARHMEIDMQFLREAEDLPRLADSYPAAQSLPPVFLPARNIIYYSVAAHVASSLGAREIVVGHNRDDVETFPDVGCDFIEAFNELLERSLPGFGASVKAPLIGLRKLEVWRLAYQLGVPLGMTWSCWRAGELHCGRCAGCMQRRKMFETLGIEDPTSYQEL